jgi:hypothetical protein
MDLSILIEQLSQALESLAKAKVHLHADEPIDAASAVQSACNVIHEAVQAA